MRALEFQGSGQESQRTALTDCPGLILGLCTLQHRLTRLWRQTQIVQQGDGRNHRHTQERQLKIGSIGVPCRAVKAHGKVQQQCADGHPHRHAQLEEHAEQG